MKYKEFLPISKLERAISFSFKKDGFFVNLEDGEDYHWGQELLGKIGLYPLLSWYKTVEHRVTKESLTLLGCTSDG